MRGPPARGHGRGDGPAVRAAGADSSVLCSLAGAAVALGAAAAGAAVAAGGARQSADGASRGARVHAATRHSILAFFASMEKRCCHPRQAGVKPGTAPASTCLLKTRLRPCAHATPRALSSGWPIQSCGWRWEGGSLLVFRIARAAACGVSRRRRRRRRRSAPHQQAACAAPAAPPPRAWPAGAPPPPHRARRVPRRFGPHTRAPAAAAGPVGVHSHRRVPDHILVFGVWVLQPLLGAILWVSPHRGARAAGARVQAPGGRCWTVLRQTNGCGGLRLRVGRAAAGRRSTRRAAPAGAVAIRRARRVTPTNRPYFTARHVFRS